MPPNVREIAETELLALQPVDAKARETAEEILLRVLRDEGLDEVADAYELARARCRWPIA